MSEHCQSFDTILCKREKVKHEHKILNTIN